MDSGSHFQTSISPFIETYRKFKPGFSHPQPIPGAAGSKGVDLIWTDMRTLACGIKNALKISYLGTQWDASVLVYRGWNHLPELAVSSYSFTAPNTVTLQANQAFHRYRALGLEGSATTRAWVFRMENAYVWTENNDGQNPLIQPSFFHSVIGIERPLGDDFRIQAQAIMKYYPNYLDPSQATGANAIEAQINQTLAATNALIQNYQDRFRPAATFRFSYSHPQSGIESERIENSNPVFLTPNRFPGRLAPRGLTSFGRICVL